MKKESADNYHALLVAIYTVCGVLLIIFGSYEKPSQADIVVSTYPDLHLVFSFLTLHGQILLLYFLHQFLVDGQTEGCVKNVVLVPLEPGRHLVLEVLDERLSEDYNHDC